MTKWKYAELTIWKGHVKLVRTRKEYGKEYTSPYWEERWKVMAEETVTGGGREVFIDETFEKDVSPSNIYYLGQMGDQNWELVGTHDRKGVHEDESYFVSYIYYFKRPADV